jgi:RNA polymerase sigma-70 factor (ECF subfamily)
MFPEASVPAGVHELRNELRRAIADQYACSDAERYGITPDTFEDIVAAVLRKYGSGRDDSEQLELLDSLRLRELILARACTAGNDNAWDDFVRLHRNELYRAARAITGDDATGRELADGLYAELFGLPNREGRRVSKLDYFMGRGSLQGCLRTVLAQQHVNRFRSQASDVSLDEQIEGGGAFAAPPAPAIAEPDSRLSEAVRASLAELSSEERYLLASYYLDGCTLAAIGRQLRVHESTISRKLDKITGGLRKRIRKRLHAVGLDARQCDEMFQELDVRDLNLKVAESLRQERPMGTF